MDRRRTLRSTTPAVPDGVWFDATYDSNEHRVAPHGPQVEWDVVSWHVADPDGRPPAMLVPLNQVDFASVRDHLATARDSDARLREKLALDEFRDPIDIVAELNWRRFGLWTRRYFVVDDGNHRIEAARQKRWPAIRAVVFNFWFWPRGQRPPDREHVRATPRHTKQTR